MEDSRLIDRRPTLLFWFFPRRYTDPEEASKIRSLGAWTHSKFRYKQDPLWGIYDSFRPVKDIVKYQRGDCVDHTLVAASWLISEERDTYITVVKTDSRDSFLHMVAHDGSMVYDYYDWYPRSDLESDVGPVVREKQIYKTE